MKVELTKEQQALFNANFDKKVYEKAKQSVQDAISQSKSFEELWTALSNYERDNDFNDNHSIIYCEVELDRYNMETPADYVGADFTIYWDDDANKGWIESVSLHTSDTPDGEVELLCFIHPETCEIIEWCYD